VTPVVVAMLHGRFMVKPVMNSSTRSSGQ